MQDLPLWVQFAPNKISEGAHRATAGFSDEKSARAIAAGKLLIQAAQAINTEVACKRHGIASNQSWWHNCQMILISHGKDLSLPVMLVSWQLDERFAGSMLCQKMDKFGGCFSHQDPAGRCTFNPARKQICMAV